MKPLAIVIFSLVLFLLVGGVYGSSISEEFLKMDLKDQVESISAFLASLGFGILVMGYLHQREELRKSYCQYNEQYKLQNYQSVIADCQLQIKEMDSCIDSLIINIKLIESRISEDFATNSPPFFSHTVINYVFNRLENIDAKELGTSKEYVTYNSFLPIIKNDIKRYQGLYLSTVEYINRFSTERQEVIRKYFLEPTVHFSNIEKINGEFSKRRNAGSIIRRLSE